MIVSHKHKFIFIKTRKTAGTSIEIQLSPLCGPDDIMTPITPADEELRRPHGPRNFRVVTEGGWPPAPRVLQLYNHMPARRVKRLVGHQVWDSYFKFTSVRNPFAQLVSQYYWELSEGNIGEGFESFAFKVIAGALPNNFKLYSIDGEAAMNFYIRFETLIDDVNSALSRVGLAATNDLPRAKTNRSPEMDWRTHYNPGLVAAVTEWAAPELRLFGYSF